MSHSLDPLAIHLMMAPGRKGRKLRLFTCHQGGSQSFLLTCVSGKEDAGMPSDAQRNHAHLMHSHLVDFLRDYLRRPELQVRSHHHTCSSTLSGLLSWLKDSTMTCWMHLWHVGSPSCFSKSSATGLFWQQTETHYG